MGESLTFTVIVVKNGIGKWYYDITEATTYRVGDNLKLLLRDNKGGTPFYGLLEKDEEIRFDYDTLSKIKKEF